MIRVCSHRLAVCYVRRAFNGTGLVSGSVVGNLTATDTDSGDTLFFTLLPSSYSYLFSLSSSGAQATLTTTADLDYESTVRDYQLTVRVADRNPDTASDALCSNVYVDVIVLDANDHAPQFSQSSYRASFREDVGVGFNTNAMRVTATDADDAGGLNGLFAYSIIGGNDDYKFRIGAQTGQVRVWLGLWKRMGW
jgi:protocadherin Fat 1/2/3